MILHSHVLPEDAQVDKTTPIAILHGLFGNWENWRSPQKALAENTVTIGLDLRNHGKSPHTDVMDYHSMADDVTTTLQSLGIERCHLLGHSMGGKVALALTATSKVQIQSLTIVDIAPRRYPGQHQDILGAMNQIQPALLSSRKEADQQMVDQVPDTMTRQFLLKNLVRNHSEGSSGYRWTLNLRALTRHYENLLQIPPMSNQFNEPTMIIRGSMSDYVTDDDVRNYQEWASDLRVETISGAGHWPHASHGARVIELLGDFYA